MTSPTTQHCNSCGAQAPAGSRFCPDCGAPSVSTGLTNFTRVRQLFDQAQSIPPDRREAWLNDICNGDSTLLGELRTMLLSTRPNTFLQQPAVALLGLTPPAGPAASFIGPYRVLRELGRGGMGVVYLAVRDDGTFRKNVAVKLLLREQVTPEFVQRFRQERQVVAALDHPNIARILDGGDAPDGMPYYVMEYVEGLPLDRYCDQQRLSLSGRIKIFQQVCHAIDYLHQNLIVHRDLKPSNILVSTDGAVKLLDFGIAKVVGAASFPSSEMTSAQGPPMTPAYASPEQLEGATPQKTSDIYSLGVILYRLLTGRQPYEGIDEKIAKLATRQDPPRPSTNIREDLMTPESTAQLRRSMMGALDSIVLMAMRYDPKQRYQSAAALAFDLGRFLDGESMTAYREPVAVRSMKLLKRKRVAIVVTAGFLVIGSFGAPQWQRVEIQKVEAAQRQAEIRSLLEQLENRTAAGGIEEVRALKTAFATDFPASTSAAGAAKSPEGEALLDRGVRYLDRIRGTSVANPDLGLAIADAYQQLGLLYAAMPDDNGRPLAVATYRKAVDVLTGIAASNPDDAAVLARIAGLNQRIASLGGHSVQEANQLQAESVPAVSQTATIRASTKRVRTQTTAPPQSVPTESAASAEPPPPPPAVIPTISPAEMREFETRVIDVTAQIGAAEQAIAPLRESLAANGQTLNPNLLATIERMHANLERAEHDLDAGDAPAARDDLTAAAALAAKALHAVGR